MDMTQTIVPRSDQINAEDLLAGPRTVTITDVRAGSAEQPVNIVTGEFGTARPFKPSKTVRRVLVAAWGAEAANYVGRQITIYRDPTITFGKDQVGGIRISHMSHIDKDVTVSLTVTRGRRAPFTVQPLETPSPVDGAIAAIRKASTTEALDNINKHATKLGIAEQITAELNKRAVELANQTPNPPDGDKA